MRTKRVSESKTVDASNWRQAIETSSPNGEKVKHKEKLL